MKRKPWFKFDPNAWLGEIHLRSCPLSARGMLIDLMCIAHNHDPYGYFLDDDSPESLRKLGKLLGVDRRVLVNSLGILRDATRISQATSGGYYIKRMVADYEYACKQSEYGRNGGNPTLKTPLKIEKRRVREEKRREEDAVDFPSELNTLRFQAAWAEWCQHRTEIKKKLTPTSTRLQLKQLSEWGEARAVAAIRRSIAGGWQGIFEGNTPGSKDTATKPKSSGLNLSEFMAEEERLSREAR